MVFVRLIVGLVLFILPGATVAGIDERMTLIVNRDQDSAEYYVSFPAADISSILATDPEIIFSENGAVPIDQFRQYGSFERADEVFSKVTAKAGERALTFEAMSLMVHPFDQPQPFETFWDGVMAISVCTVDYTSEALYPEGLRLYFGAYAKGIAPREPMTIQFPATGRDDIEVVIHRYYEGKFLSTDKAVLNDGGTLVTTTQAASFSISWFAFGALAVLVTLALPMLRSKFIA